jgi:hypothetical protein
LCLLVCVLHALRGPQRTQLTTEQVALIEHQKKVALEKRAALNAPKADQGLVYC